MDRILKSSNEGAILELVARQNKDFFFLEDKEGNVYSFDSNYRSVCPFIKERRQTVPLSEPNFGGSFEVEIEPFADVLLECNLLIQLPTWLPDLPIIAGQQEYPPITVNNYYWIKGSDGHSYGYVNYPAYFLFSNIQLYQDNFLIQQWSGDGLFITRATEGSWNSTFLDQTYVGMTGAGDRQTALRATPGYGSKGILRLKLPLPGIQTPNDGGFPLCAVPNQKFRIKATLRNLEDIVVSSNLQVKPTPWTVPCFTYTDTCGNVINAVPKKRVEIGNPVVCLETVQAYIHEDAKKYIMTMPELFIPFRRNLESIYTIGPNDYASLVSGDTALVKFLLEGRNIAERFVFAFRSENAFLTNDLSNFTNPNGPNLCDPTKGQFYKEMELFIAGKIRENNWQSFVFQEMNSLYKDDRDSGYNISEMRWNLGNVWYRELNPERQPEGGINLTTADHPTLNIKLASVPSFIGVGGKNTQLNYIAESWTIYKIDNRRGYLLFPN